MIPNCQHCHTGKVNRPRQLCWACYYSPGVRDRYPSTSKYAHRGVGNFTGIPFACEPTDAGPGTPEKMEVLAERARMRQRLWHPLDAEYVGEPKPIPRSVGFGRERKVA